MLGLVRSGQAFSEPATAERWSIRLVGVLTRLHEGHQVDLTCRHTNHTLLVEGPEITVPLVPVV